MSEATKSRSGIFALALTIAGVSAGISVWLEFQIREARNGLEAVGANTTDSDAELEPASADDLQSAELAEMRKAIDQARVKAEELMAEIADREARMRAVLGEVRGTRMVEGELFPGLKDVSELLDAGRETPEAAFETDHWERLQDSTGRYAFAGVGILGSRQVDPNVIYVEVLQQTWLGAVVRQEAPYYRSEDGWRRVPPAEIRAARQNAQVAEPSP